MGAYRVSHAVRLAIPDSSHPHPTRTPSTRPRRSSATSVASVEGLTPGGIRITKFSSRSSEYRRGRLPLYPQNRLLCGLGNPKFHGGLGWNLDLLLRLWIKARAGLPLLLHQLAKTGQDKFAVLFDRFVTEGAKRIEKYSSGSFVGLGGFCKRGLKFCCRFQLNRIARRLETDFLFKS
jgi:hypothetical protein